MSAVPVIVGYALRESVRRKVFAVVVLLTIGFLALYALGVNEAFQEVGQFEQTDEDRELTGATLLGLAMFATFFLGTVLAVFLTLSVVGGDAERGLLQPLVVRPVGRSVLLLARLLTAAVVCGAYVGAVYLGATLITGAIGNWWPSRPVVAGVRLASAVVVLAALSILGSVFLSATANGIAVFMLFGGGLLAGLLGQIGEALDSQTLQSIADTTSWALPFEALYQAALADITAETSGVAGVIVRLGPFGGAEAAGVGLALWSVAYLALVAGLAVLAFGRRDL